MCQYLQNVEAVLVSEVPRQAGEEPTRALWCHVQLPALVSARALHAEVERITKAGQSGPPGLWLASLPKAKSGSDAAAQLLASLLKWAQVICAKSGLHIRSWASSFADGQAICLLVSHTPAAASVSTCKANTESKSLELCHLALLS